MKVLAAVAAIVTSLALVTHAQTRSVDWRAERPECLNGLIWGRGQEDALYQIAEFVYDAVANAAISQ